jgi:hypothetical protein
LEEVLPLLPAANMLIFGSVALAALALVFRERGEEAEKYSFRGKVLDILSALFYIPAILYMLAIVLTLFFVGLPTLNQLKELAFNVIFLTSIFVFLCLVFIPLIVFIEWLTSIPRTFGYTPHES